MAEDKHRKYGCEVREVFSGDDLYLMVDLGVEGLWKRVRARLHGVDAPNAVNAADDSPAGRVRRMVRDIVRNRRGLFEVVSQQRGGWIGILTVESPEGVVNVNELLISQGYKFNKANQA